MGSVERCPCFDDWENCTRREISEGDIMLRCEGEDVAAASDGLRLEET
jgi:hypothetical protein